MKIPSVFLVQLVLLACRSVSPNFALVMLLAAYCLICYIYIVGIGVCSEDVMYLTSGTFLVCSMEYGESEHNQFQNSQEWRDEKYQPCYCSHVREARVFFLFTVNSP